MILSHEKMEKIFPDYHARFALPPEAKEKNIPVYRACRTRMLEQASFLNSYEENGFQVPAGLEEDAPEAYSLSTYMKLRDIKRFVASDSRYQPPLALAKGITAGCCGVCSPSKIWKTANETAPEFKNKKKWNSHVDWWLYQDARPWEHFEVIDYEEEKQRLSDQRGEQRPAP